MIPIKTNVVSFSKPYGYYIISATTIFLFSICLIFPYLKIYLLNNFSFNPENFISDPLSLNSIASLFSSIFIHSSISHLFFNLWTLYIFGINVEDKIGTSKYILYFLLCGVIANLIQCLNYQPNVVFIGSSGAIAGITGLFLVFFPRSKVVTILPLILIYYFVEIPSLFYLLVWFAFQLSKGMVSIISQSISSTGNSFPGIGWIAHSAGFWAGLIVAVIEKNRSRISS